MAILIERIRKIVVDNLDVSYDMLNTNSSFMDDLGADSLDMTELFMAFEEEFNIAIPDADRDKISRFGEAVDYLSKRVK